MLGAAATCWPGLPSPGSVWGRTVGGHDGLTLTGPCRDPGSGDSGHALNAQASRATELCPHQRRASKSLAPEQTPCSAFLPGVPTPRRTGQDTLLHGRGADTLGAAPGDAAPGLRGRLTPQHTRP